MNIREFILELKRVTVNYTSEEYYNALIRLARNISPAERMTILNVLESTRNQNTDDLDTCSLLEDIEAFYNRVKNGEYYDHWGWDAEIHEEREFGDESWAEEMDSALNMLEERFLPEKNGKKHRNDDMDWNLLNQAYIMMGKYRESFALCKNNRSLGMFVEIKWQDRMLYVPLVQLQPLNTNEQTLEAVEDWHYWMARGYVF